MLKSIIAFFLSLIAMLFPPQHIDFTYSVISVPLSTLPKAYAYMNNSDLVVKHIFSYSCGANITVNVSKEGDVVKVYEENVGEILKCPAMLKVVVVVHNPGKVSRVEIYGVKYKDVYDYELKESLSVESKHVECRSDKDCVHQSACCHQGAMPCIPKDEYRPLGPRECPKVMCTMECRPCIKCKCIEGECKSIPVGGCC